MGRHGAANTIPGPLEILGDLYVDGDIAVSGGGLGAGGASLSADNVWTGKQTLNAELALDIPYSTNHLQVLFTAGDPSHPTAPSGTYGMRLIRPAANQGAGISFWTGDTFDWDLGQDHVTNDLVLAYDGTLSIDVVRLRQGGPWMTISNSATPFVGDRLRVESNGVGTDSASLVNMLKLQIADPATPASNFISCLLGGGAMFVLDKNGVILTGRSAPSSATYIMEMARTSDATCSWRNQNSSTGTSAKAGLVLSNSADDLKLELFGTGHSSSSLAGTGFVYTSGAKALLLGTTGAERMRVTAAGSVVLTKAALATTATAGFVGIPSCAGPPTGVPEAWTFNAGGIPMVFDSTNKKLYAYVASAWVATAAFA